MRFLKVKQFIILSLMVLSMAFTGSNVMAARRVVDTRTYAQNEEASLCRPEDLQECYQ